MGATEHHAKWSSQSGTGWGGCRGRAGAGGGMGATDHNEICSSKRGAGWCDCRGLRITLAGWESGWPLTTGEGNTPGGFVGEGDVNKVKPTRQYFAELRASLK